MIQLYIGYLDTPWSIVNRLLHNYARFLSKFIKCLQLFELNIVWFVYAVDFVCFTIPSYSFSRMTYPWPSVNVSPVLRWPVSWWRGTSTRSVSWSYRRPYAGQKWSELPGNTQKSVRRRKNHPYGICEYSFLELYIPYKITSTSLQVLNHPTNKIACFLLLPWNHCLLNSAQTPHHSLPTWFQKMSQTNLLLWHHLYSWGNYFCRFFRPGNSHIQISINVHFKCCAIVWVIVESINLSTFQSKPRNVMSTKLNDFTVFACLPVKSK